MATPKVNLLLSANDQATAVINRVESALGNLAQSASSAAGGGLIGGLIGGLVGAGSVAALDAVRGLASGVVDFGIGAAQAAGQAATLRTSLDYLAGGSQNAAAMLEQMRQAARGTVSDTDLMLSANRALTLGVVDSAREAAQLLEASAKLGRSLGLSATEAFESAVTGIGRMSPQILDNIGVKAGAAVFDGYAESLGKTADKLSDVEKKQALVNVVISQAGGLPEQADNAATAFERMDAALANAKVALGELFGPTVAAVAQQIANAATGVADAMVRTQAEANRPMMAGYWADMEAQISRIRDIQAGINTSGNPIIDDAMLERAQARLVELGQTYNEIAARSGTPLIDLALLGEANILMPDLAAATNDVGGASAGAAPQVGQLSSAIRAQISEAEAATRALAGLTGQIQSFFRSNLGALGLQTAIAGSEELTRKAKAHEDVLRSLGLTSEEVYLSQQAYVTRLLDPYQAQVDVIEEAERAQVSYGKAAVKAHDDALVAAQREFDTLQGKVAGILNESLNTDVGVSTAAYLPREDAINEDARRLADVMVNGFKSPWAAYFESEFPALFAEMTAGGDIQGGAARILSEFEAGLRPDLLDKEKVKDRIRKMLLGEQSMAALAGEITAELAAEFGQAQLPEIQSMVGASLGIGDGADIGADAAAGLANEATLAKFDGAGQSAGSTWGAAFLRRVEEGVPGQLVRLLVDLVTPGVQANLAAAASQGEALP